MIDGVDQSALGRVGTHALQALGDANGQQLIDEHHVAGARRHAVHAAELHMFDAIGQVRLTNETQHRFEVGEVLRLVGGDDVTEV